MKDERWYKGEKHCLICSSLSPMKTLLVKFDDGSEAIVPVRLCWRKKKLGTKE